MSRLPTTPTPTSSAFKKRYWRGVRNRIYRGRMRGIICLPDQLLFLIRDTYPNSPVPPDAQLFSIGIDREKNLISFHFYSVANPMVNCVQLPPPLLLNIVKAQSEGLIPFDAELKGMSVHEQFTWLRLEVYSNKFKDSDSKTMPLIQFRYENKERLVYAPETKPEDREKQPVII